MERAERYYRASAQYRQWKRCLILWFLLVLCLPASAQPVQVQVAGNVTARQVFTVTVRGTLPEDTPVTLSVVGDPKVHVSGTVEARVVQGTAVFPAVLLDEGGQGLRLAAYAQGTVSLSEPLTVAAPAAAAVGNLFLDPVPDQVAGSLFQITATVLDTSGRPLEGALVHVRVDPEHARTQALIFFHGETVLVGPSGAATRSLQAPTDRNGKAVLWLRLSNEITPFDSRLLCTVDYAGKTIEGSPSNLFSTNTPP